MKVLQLVKYGEIKDSLTFNEVSIPTLQSTDLLIEVKAAAINPIDKLIVLGNLQGMLPIQLPSAIGYDVSGIVVEKGDEVSIFEIGDLVYSRVPQEQMGTIAEYVAVTSIAVSKTWKYFFRRGCQFTISRTYCLAILGICRNKRKRQSACSCRFRWCW